MLHASCPLSRTVSFLLLSATSAMVVACNGSPEEPAPAPQDTPVSQDTPVRRETPVEHPATSFQESQEEPAGPQHRTWWERQGLPAPNYIHPTDRPGHPGDPVHPTDRVEPPPPPSLSSEPPVPDPLDQEVGRSMRPSEPAHRRYEARSIITIKL